MGHAHFEHADFLEAARTLAVQLGPAGVTVGSVTQHLGAPSGSFYYRFASRDVLLAELWLISTLAFQEGFIAAVDAGNGLDAALHTPRWARDNLHSARLLLLHHRSDFVRGEWPEKLKVQVAAQAEQVTSSIKRFARDNFKSADSTHMRKAAFVLLEVPLAAVRPHLRRAERPPEIVDELIRTTYAAILES